MGCHAGIKWYYPCWVSAAANQAPTKQRQDKDVLLPFPSRLVITLNGEVQQ